MPEQVGHDGTGEIIGLEVQMDTTIVTKKHVTPDLFGGLDNESMTGLL